MKLKQNLAARSKLKMINKRKLINEMRKEK